MNRLRGKLRRYYSTEGAQDPVQIDCRSGYSLRFTEVAQTRVSLAPGLMILPLRTDAECATWASEFKDELHALFSRTGWLQLVSQTTAQSYADRSGDIRDFAAETAAHFILEGTLRQTNNARKLP